MIENDCPFLFEFESKVHCVLGHDCLTKTPDERVSCRNVSNFFNKGISEDEIRDRKMKMIFQLRKKTGKN